MKLRDMTIEGKTIAINVDGISGRFKADWNGEEIEAQTLNELTAQLTKLVRTSRAETPVEVTVLGLVPLKEVKTAWRMSSDGPYTEGDGYVHAVLRGKHSRQHDTWLLTDLAGQKFQFAPRLHSGRIITRRLSGGDVARYLDLCTERRKAVEALTGFLNAVVAKPEELLAKRVTSGGWHRGEGGDENQ